MVIKRVIASADASNLIKELQEKYGNLMFHLSGGCCDGSSPMCFQKGEFKIGSNDVRLSIIDGCEFWMDKDQFEYLKNCQLELTVMDSFGSGFSLEVPTGKRFGIKSILFSQDEINNLEPLFFKQEQIN